MDLIAPWPDLRRFLDLARQRPVEVWLFGSALRRDHPTDLDLLVIYQNREDVVTLRGADWWQECAPPLDIIAMTPGEERELAFIAGTHAVRLF
jgi:predicted nucleotidyltransferase